MTAPVDTPAPAGNGPVPPPRPARLSAVADLAVRIAGVLVGVAGGLFTAVLEVLLTPVRLGGVRFPAAVLLAVVGNLLLIWFTYRATSHRGAALLPGLVWFVVMFRAAGRTAEGDLLLTSDNWVGLATIFAGTLAFAVGAYRLIVPRAVAQP